jgi:protein phosphatase
VRLAAGVVVVVAVLVGGGVLARIWVLQQYYVGVDTQQVSIFQGVRGEVLGVPLHRVAERSGINLDDLPETERSAVRDGIITSDGLTGARGLVERLRGRMLEPCPPPVVSQPPPPVPGPTLNPPPVPGVPPVDTTPLPKPAPEPGTTCRSVS